MDPIATIAAPAAETPAAPKPPANRSVRQRAQMMQANRQQQAAPSSAPAGAVPTTPNPSAPGAARSDVTVPAGTVPVATPAPAAPPAIASVTIPPDAPPPGDVPPAPAGEDAAELLGAEAPLFDDAEIQDDPGDGEQAPQWLQDVLNDPDVPKVKKTLIKRIHSLADQRDSERNARLELERDRAQAAVAPPPEAQPAPPAGAENHPTVRAIDGQLSNALAALEILERHPEGGELTRPNGQPLLDAQGRPMEMTPDEVRNTRLKYHADLSRLNAERAATVIAVGQSVAARQSEATSLARTSYPWMNNRESTEYQTAMQVLREFPGVKDNPEWPLVVGRYVTGLMAERSAAARMPSPRPAPMTRPKGGNNPPPVAAQRTVAAPAADPVADSIAEARKTYRAAPTVKNRSKLFALERQQSTAA